MYRVKQLINILVYVVFLTLVFFLMLYQESISEAYNISSLSITVFCLVSILYLGYKYMLLEFSTGKLEHEFRSIMNHAFRTPLTRVMWFTKELEKDMPQKDRLIFLQNINNATTRVLDIIDLLVGIKDVKDVSSYVFQATSLREVVERSINNYREEINNKNLVFHVGSFTNIPLLSVDLKKISFVIDTLIENAISYTPNGGKITIECKTEKRMLTLSVADSGIGLTWSDKMRIFSRFYRGTGAKKVNTDGMGIRLYLSKQIINRHSGSIYAKSKGKNKGAIFFVELPFINS